MSNFVCRNVAQDPAIKDILNINENVPGKIKVKWNEIKWIRSNYLQSKAEAKGDVMYCHETWYKTNLILDLMMQSELSD